MLENDTGNFPNIPLMYNDSHSSSIPNSSNNIHLNTNNENDNINNEKRNNATRFAVYNENDLNFNNNVSLSEILNDSDRGINHLDGKNSFGNINHQNQGSNKMLSSMSSEATYNSNSYSIPSSNNNLEYESTANVYSQLNESLNNNISNSKSQIFRSEMSNVNVKNLNEIDKSQNQRSNSLILDLLHSNATTKSYPLHSMLENQTEPFENSNNNNNNISRIDEDNTSEISSTSLTRRHSCPNFVPFNFNQLAVNIDDMNVNLDNVQSGAVINSKNITAREPNTLCRNMSLTEMSINLSSENLLMINSNINNMSTSSRENKSRLNSFNKCQNMSLNNINELSAMELSSDSINMGRSMMNRSFNNMKTAYRSDSLHQINDLEDHNLPQQHRQLASTKSLPSSAFDSQVNNLLNFPNRDDNRSIYFDSSSTPKGNNSNSINDNNRNNNSIDNINTEDDKLIEAFMHSNSGAGTFNSSNSNINNMDANSPVVNNVFYSEQNTNLVYFALYTAIENENLIEIDAILKKYLYTNDSLVQTALPSSLLNIDPQTVAFSINYDLKNMQGFDPQQNHVSFLQAAVKSGNSKMAEIFLEVNANPNYTDLYGWNSLHWAAYLGHKDIVEVLTHDYENSVNDIMAKTNNGETAIDFAKVKGHVRIEKLLKKLHMKKYQFHFVPHSITSSFVKDESMSQDQQKSKNESLPRQCGFCKKTDTPQWRKGPKGKGTLCNACGLKWHSQMVKEENLQRKKKRKKQFSDMVKLDFLLNLKI
eukprot:Awhi_evm1s4224